MKPVYSLLGRIAQSRLLATRTRRVSLLASLFAVFLVLALYPEKQRAAVTLAPTDPATLGLNGAALQLGSGGSVFGSQAALDLSVRIGRSVYVRKIVDRRLGIARKLGKSETSTLRWLEQNVDVRTLRGGIIQIEMKSGDARFAQQVVSAYADALREQLGIISKTQIAYKRQILEELVSSSGERYSRAQNAFDQYRRANRTANPDAILGQFAARGPAIENQIYDKERQLANLLKFATPENIQVQRVQADLNILRKMLFETQSAERSAQGSLEQVISKTSQLAKLQRELDVSRELYYNYRRTLQQTSVEDLTAGANVRILEPAYIDPERQYNSMFLALAVLTALLFAALEFYHFRPPVNELRLAR